MTEMLPEAAAELERWRDEGLVLPVWLRDDDAIKPSAALERLLSIAGGFDAPLHLAIIPQQVEPVLAERLRETKDVFVIAHGWTHENHALADKKKAEFGPCRELSNMLEEIRKGRRRLSGLFPEQALPIFTPPWNRIAPEVVGKLRETGFVALSTFMPRASKFAAPDLLQVNTHFDPVAWKAGKSLVDVALLDARFSAQLRARRTGAADNAEPYGILTHHLVHDDAIWGFLERLLAMLARSGVIRWTAPLEEIY